MMNKRQPPLWSSEDDKVGCTRFVHLRREYTEVTLAKKLAFRWI